MNSKPQDAFLQNRAELAKKLGCADLYEYIDQFALYAGTHTIGNKLFTYDAFRLSSGVPGHIAEFGSWKGSNLLFLAKLKTLLEPHSPKKVIAFDNFSGLPPAAEEDGGFAKDQQGEYCGNEEVLRQCIELFEFEDLVELVVGDACETIPTFSDARPETVLSFAYIDFDLYEPTKAALRFIDGCISVGGVIVFDEACMDQWPGETLAMKEYLNETPHSYEAISNQLSRQPTVALKRIA